MGVGRDRARARDGLHDRHAHRRNVRDRPRPSPIAHRIWGRARRRGRLVDSASLPRRRRPRPGDRDGTRAVVRHASGRGRRHGGRAVLHRAGEWFRQRRPGRGRHRRRSSRGRRRVSLPGDDHGSRSIRVGGRRVDIGLSFSYQMDEVELAPPSSWDPDDPTVSGAGETLGLLARHEDGLSLGSWFPVHAFAADRCERRSAHRQHAGRPVLGGAVRAGRVRRDHVRVANL